MIHRNDADTFQKAKKVWKEFFDELTEEDIQALRDIFLKRTWKMEAKELKSMREQLEMEIKDVAASLDLKPTDIRRLENAKDFNNRDRVAEFLKSFYKTRFK